MSIVKSLSVGNGDMFYIRHGSDSFTIIDCCLSDENKDSIFQELKRQSSAKGVLRFISTHPDDDHIAGLAYLDDRMDFRNFYCVENNASKKPESWTEDFERYCRLRGGEVVFHLYKGCSRRWLNDASTERGGAGLNFLWPILSNPNYVEALYRASNKESPNNISPIFTYSIQDGPTFLWMGDLELNFQEKIQDEIRLPKVDVLFAPHHGRKSGRVCKEWLEQMAPGVIVIGEAPSENLHYYDDWNTITQNSAWDIVFDASSDGKMDVYVSNYHYSVDFLAEGAHPDAHGAYYLGTYEVGS